jgi:hypothetical protein
MPHTKRVFDYFESEVIPLLQKAGCKSMLYIGWRHDCKPWWHDYMAKQLGGPLGVLEIFPKNISDLEHEVWNERYDVASIIAGDARDPGSALVKNYWDLIFWDHGPEHVTWDDLQAATPKLYDYAGKALLYCCPWGEWPQDAEDGNQHEVHRNYVTKEQISSLGMTIKTFGEPGSKGEGELVALLGK